MRDPGTAAQLGRLLFAGRWLLLPVQLGLLVGLALVVAKFALTLLAAVPVLPGMTVGTLLLLSLKLTDLALVANLLLMVALGSWDSFVAPLLPDADPARPDWLGHADFAGLKGKVIGSVVLIAAIDLLETFLNIETTAKADVLWQVAILLAFAVAGVLLAWMDRLAGPHHRGGGGEGP